MGGREGMGLEKPILLCLCYFHVVSDLNVCYYDTEI